MFTRTLKRSSTLYGLGKRTVMISPAVNNATAYNFAAVLPFGWDFVTEELRQVLVSRNVDVDNLEKKYNNEIQNDSEFNNPALPSQNSQLWGFVYANRLVKVKVQLDTLTNEEEYLRNYLNGQVNELSQRMNRYYPHLDWKGEYNKQLLNENKDVNKSYQYCHANAVADLICNNTNGDDKYVSLFANNSFIQKYDENDKFNDFLPKNLESKMIKYFDFYFDHSSNQTDPSKYFDSISNFEKTLSTPLNALSKELRQNFGLFMLDCFSNNPSIASDVVNAIASSSSSICYASDDAQSDVLVSKCLGLLEIKSGKVSKANSEVLGILFFGNSDSGKQLSGQDVTQVASVLASAGNERVNTVYKALQIEQYLKQNGPSRLLVSALVAHSRDFMAQFLTDSSNIDAFSSANSGVLDNVVSTLKKFVRNQEKLSKSISSFVDALSNSVSKDKKADKNSLNNFLTNEIFNNLLPSSSSSSDDISLCFVLSGLSDYVSSCNDNNDVFGALKGNTYINYLLNNGNNVFEYKLLKGLVTPSRNGFSGDNLIKIANVITSDSSNASDIIFESVAKYLLENGLLSDNQIGGIKSDLSSLVSSEFDNLRNVCNEFDQSRIENANAFKDLTLKFDGKFHFDHVKESYDPLNIHLSQFRYLSPN